MSIPTCGGSDKNFQLGGGGGVGGGREGTGEFKRSKLLKESMKSK